MHAASAALGKLVALDDVLLLQHTRGSHLAEQQPAIAGFVLLMRVSTDLHIMASCNPRGLPHSGSSNQCALLACHHGVTGRGVEENFTTAAHTTEAYLPEVHCIGVLRRPLPPSLLRSAALPPLSSSCAARKSRCRRHTSPSPPPPTRISYGNSAM